MPSAIGKRGRSAALVACLLVSALILASVQALFAPPVSAADEYDALREKWKVMLTGGTSFSTSDPDIAAQIAAITATAQSHWDTMDKSSSRTYLWSDLTFSDAAHYTSTYKRLKEMALAWATKGSSLQNNASLLADIKDALDWMYANKYNETTTKSGNWWDWEVGAPLHLNDTVVLLYDQLSSAQINNYMNAVDHFQPTITMTGANRVWECTVIAIRGIIVKDGAKIAAARDGASPVLDYVTAGDGFYRDGSFIQHNMYAYNGGYGGALLFELSKLMYLLSGSTWEITDPDKQNVYEWVYNAFEPLMYKGAMMDMTRGREISRDYQDAYKSGHNNIQSIIRISQFAPPADAARMKSMVKYWIQSGTYSSFYAIAPIDMIVRAKAIVNDSSVPSRGELVKHHRYPGMDRAVHLRPGFGFAISAHSSRIANFESINNENLKGWYTGEGMTYLYNNDLGQYSDGFWPTVNPYRLPGTTVQKDTAVASGSKSTKNWVGGSDIAGEYGTMGMELLRHDSLSMKKSWFMFDDEVVALGAGISCTNGKTIETIVENRKLNAAGNNAFTVNGAAKSTSLGWSETMSGVNWAHLAGSAAGSDIGYYFPDGATLKGLREARTGTWKAINNRPQTPNDPITRNYLTLWFDHGANPSNATYSYVLLPNKSASQTGSYAANPDITILENSTDAQAVRENTLNVTGINFWNDITKTVGGVTSNRKASVMVRETATEIEVAVSDPTQASYTPITIELDKAGSATISKDSGVTVSRLSPTIKFTVTVSGAKGKTFRVKFAKADGDPGEPGDPGDPGEPPGITYEAEDLTASTSSGDTRSAFDDTMMSGGKGDKLDANAAGDFVAYNVNVPAAGTYKVLVGVKKHATRGIFQLAIDGVNQGSPQDGYNATVEYIEADLGNKTFSSSGTKEFRFTVTGKNANSLGYTLAFDYIKLVPVSATIITEAESLSAVTSPGDTRSAFTDSAMSGGMGDKFDPNAAGDYITYDVNVPAGTYTVYVAVKKHASRGIFQLYINGVPQGTPKDNYSAANSYEEFNLGNVTFGTSGTQAFKFEVTGKHPCATDYTLGLDYIKLVPVP